MVPRCYVLGGVISGEDLFADTHIECLLLSILWAVLWAIEAIC